MVAAAKAQVADAEKHLGETLQRAERLLTDTDAVVRRRQEDARRAAEATIAAAEGEAEQVREAARIEAQAERAAAQRTVERLERQRESIAAYLEEMRGLLGSETATGLEGLTPMQQLPAVLAQATEEAEGEQPAPVEPPASPVTPDEESAATDLFTSEEQ